MDIRAIVFGATGMVGEGVLHMSLKNPDVKSVLVIGRRPCNVKHEKLKEIVHNDFFDYSKIEGQLIGYNACFFCLGVTSVGKKEPEYTRLTYDLTMSAARTLAKQNRDMIFCYISGTGTDSTEKGKLMWARVKGKTENDLAKLSFKASYAFRPGFIRPIDGLHNAPRIMKVVGFLYPAFKFLFPSHGCSLDDLGSAMIRVASDGYSKKILENIDIDLLAKGI